MNRPLAIPLIVPNPMDTSGWPFAILLDFLLRFITTQRHRTSGPSRLNSKWISLAVVKATLTGEKCHHLDGYTNGSAPTTPSMLLPATTFMMTLDNDNLGVPFSWVMGRSHPLSPLLALTLQGWDAGPGLPSRADRDYHTYH